MSDEGEPAPEGAKVNIVPSVKKIVKKVNPNARIRNSTVEALSECAVDFAKLIIEKSAQICESDGKNLMQGDHLLRALTELGITTIYPEVKERNTLLCKLHKERIQTLAESRKTQYTEEEAIRIQAMLRKEALEKLKESQK